MAQVQIGMPFQKCKVCAVTIDNRNIVTASGYEGENKEYGEIGRRLDSFICPRSQKRGDHDWIFISQLQDPQQQVSIDINQRRRANTLEEILKEVEVKEPLTNMVYQLKCSFLTMDTMKHAIVSTIHKSNFILLSYDKNNKEGYGLISYHAVCPHFKLKSFGLLESITLLDHDKKESTIFSYKIENGINENAKKKKDTSYLDLFRPSYDSVDVCLLRWGHKDTNFKLLQGDFSEPLIQHDFIPCNGDTVLACGFKFHGINVSIPVVGKAKIVHIDGYRIYLDIMSIHGFSGGAIFSLKGKLIGIIYGSTGSRSAIAHAVLGEEFEKFLNNPWKEGLDIRSILNFSGSEKKKTFENLLRTVLDYTGRHIQNGQFHVNNSIQENNDEQHVSDDDTDKNREIVYVYSDEPFYTEFEN